MKYIFDTNILLHYLRKTPLARQVDADFQPFHPANILILSTVSVGEIRSISMQNNWGTQRLAELQNALLNFVIVGVTGNDLVERYTEIDTFSQGKLASTPLGTSSKNMGKNDLWIAATASILGARLFTTDTDFGHLKGVFLELELFKVS